MVPSLQYLAVEWLVPLIMVPFVARGRRPFPAIAWLGFIFAVPWVGVPLYLLIGEYGQRRRRRRHTPQDPIAVRHEILPTDLDESMRPLALAVQGLVDDRGEPAPILTTKAFDLLQDMDAVDRLVEDIEAAEDRVHLLFFIYADDDTGWRVAQALADAAARGVRCRLLMDAHGSRKAWRSIRPWLTKRGVRVSRALKLSPFEKPVRRIDVRNHRKIAVIDGAIGYTGSMNIHGSSYDLDEGTWSQITARLEGAAAVRLQQIFAHDWFLSTDERLDLTVETGALEQGPGPAVQVLEDGPNYSCNSIHPMLADLLHGARERIALTTPYLVPDDPILLALRMAGLRGVQVDVYVPRQSDRGLADAAGHAIFDELLAAGVRIHRHGPGVLHAKTITVDDAIAVIGTANLDYRSFFLNYEVVLIVYDRDAAGRLREMQQGYGDASERVDRDAWNEARSTRESTADAVARLFSPLL